MNEMRIALVVLTTLLITACGLQGDLYIPDESASAAANEPPNQDGETGEDKKADQSSEPTP